MELIVIGLLQAVLNAGFFFGALCVVETVKRTDKIAGDTSDALERHIGKVVFRVYEIAVYFEVNAAKVLFGIFCVGAFYIVVDFFLWQISACYVNIDHNFPLPIFYIAPLRGAILFYHNILYKSMVILHNILTKTLSGGIVMQKNIFVRL